MLGTTSAYHKAILGRVDDPLQRSLLAQTLEDSDMALEQMLHDEAAAKELQSAAVPEPVKAAPQQAPKARTPKRPGRRRVKRDRAAAGRKSWETRRANERAKAEAAD